MGLLLVAEDCEPLTTLSCLIAAQDRASAQEKTVWMKRGAIKNTREGPQKGLWRSNAGHFVLPTSLLLFAIRWGHGQDHCARGKVLRHLQAIWWSPFIAATVDRILHECDVCAQYNMRKAIF